MNLQFFIWLEAQSLCQPAPVGGQHGRGGKESPHRLGPVANGGKLHL
jgi:hypothetical protein